MAVVIVVLNAFRHQRKKRCCTARGRGAIRTGAQRLPASKEETRALITDVSPKSRCSTPSGIKGRNAVRTRVL